MINDENTSWEQIASKLHHEMNKKELAEFDRLLLTEKHLNEFNSVKQINERLTEVGYISAGQGDQSWKKIERTIKIRRFKKLNAMLKYAAIIILAFGTGLVFRPSSKIEKIATDIRYSEIRVPFGQMSQVVLSDGTKIWLNSGTTIRYPEQFAADSRSVTINGEAYFEVAKMAHKPFTVNSSDLKIEVLGTSFNISAYQEDQESAVTLVEGKVNETLGELNKLVQKKSRASLETLEESYKESMRILGKTVDKRQGITLTHQLLSLKEVILNKREASQDEFSSLKRDTKAFLDKLRKELISCGLDFEFAGVLSQLIEENKQRLSAI